MKTNARAVRHPRKPKKSIAAILGDILSGIPANECAQEYFGKLHEPYRLHDRAEELLPMLSIALSGHQASAVRDVIMLAAAATVLQDRMIAEENGKPDRPIRLRLEAIKAE